MDSTRWFYDHRALALALSIWLSMGGFSLAVAQTNPHPPLQIDAHSKLRPEQTGPISSIAHGAMLDRTGIEIMPSLHFVEIAQKWYRDQLVKKLSARNRQVAKQMEQRFASDVNVDRQSRLVANARILDWVLERSSAKEATRARTRLHVLHRHLKVQLPAEPSTEWRENAVPFEINPDLLQKLQKDKTLTAPGRAKLLLITPTSGLPYRQLCSDHGVPLRENFGPGTRWQSQGTYTGNLLYLARTLNAEVLSFQSTTPPGLCVALPRYGSDQIVQADGVICFGQTDPLGGPPKACFWDNQVPGPTNIFTFTRGAAQPISQFVGGSDLRASVGNVCSDCHAGENPLIIHDGPLQNLQGNLPAAWYDPIVRTGDTQILGGVTVPVPWPENPGPMNSPPSCTGCHGAWNARGTAGRLPHLASNLGRYCATVLRPSVGALPWNVAGGARPPSMPVGNAGGLACTPTKPGGDTRCNATMTASCTINATTGGVDTGANPTAANYIQCTPELAGLLNWCGQAPAANGSTRGDPHVRNVNGVLYDFQAAGEFVYLRAGLGTELQVRQSPVSTQQPIGPDSHTGLTSCVSINTAMAARVGSTRVTLQSALNGEVDPKSMELRIDGKSVALNKSPIKLDGGGRINRSALGTGIEIDFPDKTHVRAIPNFWGAPHNVWYLDVEISNTPGRDGILGAIPLGSWLPTLADGSSLGPLPGSLSQRFVDFNQRFADSWRVSLTDSLFDYGPGTSTKDFTLRDWPPEKPPCIVPNSKIPPAEPMNPDKAKIVCSRIRDKDLRAQCVMDVTATGDATFAMTYLTSQALKKLRKN